MTDLLVIGGGPAGLACANKLMQLLDDTDGSLAAALWQKPGAVPALDQVLRTLVE